MARNQHTHRRSARNYLLNKKFQLRYVAGVVAMSVLICTTLGYLIWQQDATASATIRQQVAEPNMPPELAAFVSGSLQTNDQSLVLTMVLMGLALVSVLSVVLLIMTHKVAGPLFKMSAYFERMSHGQLGETSNLRSGDLLQRFYASFQTMHENVRLRHQKTNELLERFVNKAESLSPPDDACRSRVEKLRLHVKSRREALVSKDT